MNKGFTLIEIIAVIVILGIIGAIAVPVSNNVIRRSKQKMYLEQEERIIDACKEYVLEHDDRLPEEDGTSNIYISTLKSNGYLNNEDLKNPLNGEEMRGYIEISFDGTEYVYEYKDE